MLARWALRIDWLVVPFSMPSHVLQGIRSQVCLSALLVLRYYHTFPRLYGTKCQIIYNLLSGCRKALKLAMSVSISSICTWMAAFPASSHSSAAPAWAREIWFDSMVAASAPRLSDLLMRDSRADRRLPGFRLIFWKSLHCVQFFRLLLLLHIGGVLGFLYIVWRDCFRLVSPAVD